MSASEQIVVAKIAESCEASVYRIEPLLRGQGSSFTHGYPTNVCIH